MVAVAALAAVIAAGFGLAVLNQYWSRRKPYQAVWGAALLMFALAAAVEAVAAAGGWTAGLYKVYYLFGALLNVGWLAVGTVFVLRLERSARVALAVMALLTVVSVAAIVLAHVDESKLHASLPQRASDVPAALPALINAVGTVILVGGAAWSAWQTYRRQAPAGRVVGLALIAAGALVVGAAHTIAITAGIEVLRPVSEAVGIAVMCVGYLAVEAQRWPLRRTRTA